MDTSNLIKKWKGFNWDVDTCDGHNLNKLLKKIKTSKVKKPKVLVAKTIKGKGVSFMENNNDWHHGRLTEKLYSKAINNLK